MAASAEASPQAAEILRMAAESAETFAHEARGQIIPDRTETVLANIVTKCQMNGVTMEDLMAGKSSAAMHLYDVKKLFHMGETVPEVVARFADVLRTILHKNSGKPLRKVVVSRAATGDCCQTQRRRYRDFDSDIRTTAA